MYENYKGLYTLEREQVLAEFQSNNPHLSEFESEMERYEKLENEINQLPSQQSLTAAIQLTNGISTSINYKMFTVNVSLIRTTEIGSNCGS